MYIVHIILITIDFFKHTIFEVSKVLEKFCNDFFLSNHLVVDDFVGHIDVAIVEDSKDILSRSINSFSKQKVSKAKFIIVSCEFVSSILKKIINYL